MRILSMWSLGHGSKLREGDTALAHIFPGAIGVGNLAGRIAFEEQELADPFSGIDAGGQGRGVGDLDRDMPLPLRLERRHIDDDAAARIGGFAEADHENITGDAEIFDGGGERETVAGDDAYVRFAIDEALCREGFGVDDDAFDIGEDLEVPVDPRVIAIGGKPIGDDPLAGLLFDKGLDHAAGLGGLPDPAIGHDRHGAASPSRVVLDVYGARDWHAKRAPRAPCALALSR